MSETARTLVLLGGSKQQVAAIEAARACGYRTVLCDYLPDNPGQFVADVFYQESTTDREAVLKVARLEGANGIVAYSSDPAAPTAAYVAEKLGLPTNPLSAVEKMSVKTLFRDHLKESGFPCPNAVGIPFEADLEAARALLADFKLPIVIKPTDSSGSKGVTVLRNYDGLATALDYARACGRNGLLIAEEYIERSFPFVVGGDVFVIDGEVRFWGLMSCLRDATSPLVPVGKKMPSGLSGAQMKRVKDVVQRLVTSLGIVFGELNIEIIIGEGDMPYVLELGARAGGNMIPVQLSDVSEIDLVRANVMCAMGDDPGDISWEVGNGCYATYVLHTPCEGHYQGAVLSPKAEAACYRRVFYQDAGMPVGAFDGANKALGILFFKFASTREMDAFFEEVGDHVKVEVA